MRIRIGGELNIWSTGAWKEILYIVGHRLKGKKGGDPPFGKKGKNILRRKGGRDSIWTRGRYFLERGRKFTVFRKGERVSLT